jgi:hypothetical protein
MNFPLILEKIGKIIGFHMGRHNCEKTLGKSGIMSHGKLYQIFLKSNCLLTEN